MKYSKSIDLITLKRTIVQILSENRRSLNIKQIAWNLDIKEKKYRKNITTALDQLVLEDLIIKQNNYKFKSKNSEKTIVGIIDINRSGHGYVMSDLFDEDIFIHEKNRLTSLNKDTVAIRLMRRNKHKKEGVVTKILSRANTKFIGCINDDGKNAFFIPDNNKIGSDFFIPREKLNMATHGSRVIIELIDWPIGAGCPFGQVLRVLKNDLDLKTEIASNIEIFNIRNECSVKIEDELKKLSENIQAGDLKNRRDFRDDITFTIDPVDAKDFDDAISIKFLKNSNFEIGIHIADVSHYVKPNSEIDKEAFLRAFSVYFPGQVVPMLPEKLSNKICSLRPEEDKLSFSVVVEINDSCIINSTWVGKGVINSSKRFTYAQADEIILKKGGEHVRELIALNEIAKNLRSKRVQKGSIEFERTGLNFKLSPAGEPIKIEEKRSLSTHKLVEEFMLLANTVVATKLSELKLSIYRVHDSPDLQQLKELSIYLKSHPDEKMLPVFTKKNIPQYINSLLKTNFKTINSRSIENLVLRSMAKAKYSTNNIGHFGLGFEKYTHFTSPIRRYADLIIHRILEKYLDHKNCHFLDLERQCVHFSNMEKTYVEVERKTIKFIQLKLLENSVGLDLRGFISGVKKWGIYVELECGRGEGLVPVNNLNDENYYYNESLHTYVGQKSGKKYTLGQKVVVEINTINLVRRELDLIIK